MFAQNLTQKIALEKAIAPNPIIVTVNVTITEAIARMSEARGSCTLITDTTSETNFYLTEAQASCVLVTDNNQLVGILTERDIVRLNANDQLVANQLVAEVMISPVIRLKKSDFTNIFAALNFLQVHKIRHLPVVDENQYPIGLLTYETLRQLLRPIDDLLRQRIISEVVTTAVIHATPETSILDIAKLMANHKISSVVITEKSKNPKNNPENTDLIAVGIITERDIFQFQALGLDFNRIQAKDVMIYPVFSLPINETLWTAQQLMQQKRLSRVVVVGDRQELLGIVTQTNLFQFLNPVEIYKQVETLEQKISLLEVEKMELLAIRNQELENLVKKRTEKIEAQAKRERIVREIANIIRLFLNLQDTLNAIVREVRQCLNCDRVMVYQFQSDWTIKVVAEAVKSGWISFLGHTIIDNCFTDNWLENYQQGKIKIINNIINNDISISHKQLLESLEVKAKIIMPILVGDRLWGLMFVAQNDAPRNWQQEEIELIKHISTQAAIAIHQAELYQQIQQELKERKRAENNLRESEHLYRTTLSNISDAVFITNDEGKLTFICPNVEILFGYTTEEVAQLEYIDDLLGKDLFDPQQLAHTGEIINIENNILDKQGKLHTILINIKSVEIGPGTRLYTCRDISDRKQVEKALQNSEEHLRTIVETSASGLVTVNAKGTVVFANPAAAKMFGMTSQELCGWSLGFSYACGFPKFEEIEIYHPTGEQRIANIQTAVISWEGQNACLISLSDITQLKKAEALLRQSETKYRLLVENLPVGLVVHAANTSILTCNAKAGELLELSLSQMQGKTALDPAWYFFRENETIMPIEEYPVNLVISTKQPLENYVFGVNRPLSKTRIWVLVNAFPVFDNEGRIEQAIVTFVDISDRKQIEKALGDSEKRFRSIFEQAAVGMCQASLTGVFRRVNQRFCDILGYKSSELLGMTFHNITHPDDIPADIEQIKNLLSGKIKTYSNEKRYIKKDNSLVWVNITISLLNDTDGNPQQFISVIEDITARKQAENDLQNLVTGAAAVTGKDFFPILTEYIAKVLDVSYVIISKQEGNNLHTQALWLNGNLQPNILIPIENSPCHHVIETGSFFYPEGIQQHFPHNELLSQIAAEGYLGVALTDIRGNTIGCLCIFDNKPLVNISRSIAMLRVFAARVSAELERQEAMAALQKLNHELETRVEQRTAALRESEERFRTFVENASDIIWSIDTQGKISYISPNIITLLGYESQEIIHNNISKIFTHLDDLPQQNIFREIINSGKSYNNLEYRVQHKNGSWRWHVSNISTIKNDQGSVVQIMGINRDITERKQMEEALRYSEERFRITLMNSPIVVFNQDLQLRYTWIYNSILGLKPEEVIGKFDTDIFMPEDARKLIDLKRQVLVTGKGIKEEVVVNIAADFKCYVLTVDPLLDRNGNIEGVTGTALDITDRKKTELALKESQYMIERITEASPDILYIYDLQEQRNIYSNREIKRLLNYSNEEILAMSTQIFHEIFHPDDLPKIIEHHKLCSLAKDADIKEIEYRIRDRQGNWHWFISRDTAFSRNEDNTVKQILGAASEITERKRIETELRQTNAELARATRLKDEFLANMSHELRTPLNAILGMSEGLLEGVFQPLNDRQAKAIKTIERSGKYLLELINDILDLSKVESGKLELQIAPIAVSYLCESSLTFIKQQATKKNIQISSEIPIGLPEIVADERRIRQVLINLLNNAVKFTPENGNVKLIVETEQQQEQTFLGFSVIDTGIGIAQENISKLFQPFFQIDSSLSRQHNGTGLGLSLVRRLTEMHKGTVSISSELGRGSCFTVRLPYLTKTNSNITTNDMNSMHSHNSQVLIVEDSIVAAEQVARYLSEIGMQPTIYCRGEGAIETAARIQPALIILDIQLPGISGWEVLTQLKSDSHTENIPVLMISVVDERSRGLSLGAADYLVKPITRDQLRQSLEKLHNSQDTTESALIITPNITTVEAVSPALILLAEDNEANIATISSYLRGRGYRLILAKNGQDALTLAQQERPDLILMDIQMPGMDGLEAIRLLRSNGLFINTPIIALTALAMPEDREKCLIAGASEYLTKPVKLKRLVEMIQKLL